MNLYYINSSIEKLAKSVPLGRIYAIFIYLSIFSSVVFSVVYSFSPLRGKYLLFLIDEDSYYRFSVGTMLIIFSLFYYAVKQVGPLSASFTQIFWRFRPDENFYKKTFSFSLFTISIVALNLSNTLIYILLFEHIDILSVFSVVLLSSFFGVVLFLCGCLSQVSNNILPMRVWNFLSFLIGILLILSTSSTSLGYILDTHLKYICGPIVIFPLIFLFHSLVATKNKPFSLDHEKLDYSFKRKESILVSILNLSSSEGYRYYGEYSRFFNKVNISSIPIISLLSVLSSSKFFLFFSLISIPVCILLGILFGGAGIITFMLIGVSAISYIYRWMAREWVAESSLRSWLGGSYISQLIKYSTGPVVFSSIYSLYISVVFSLPSSNIFISSILSVIICLGDPTPSKVLNYDISVITPDGIILPFEYVKIAVYISAILSIHILAATSDDILTIAFPISFFILTIFLHKTRNNSI